MQCCGAGSISVGSICFWVSWFRIRIFTLLAFHLLARKAGGTLEQPEPAAWRLRTGGPPAQLAEVGRRIHGHLQPAASPPPPRPCQVQDKDKNQSKQFLVRPLF